MKPPLLSLEHVSKTFRPPGAPEVRAVRDASLAIGEGETVALIGESGSGKTTLGRIALALLAPDAGRVVLDGKSLWDLSPDALRATRIIMQPVFQDATASLNPRRSVKELLGQAFRPNGAALEERAVRLLESVELRPGREYLPRYPHELSGGQRQRLAIARALAVEPRLIIADEPLSGADVSIRGQILNLMMKIKEERRVAYLMITHDISIARAFADRVAVMKEGELVETGGAKQVLAMPSHPYTRRLVAAVPSLDFSPRAAILPGS